MVLMQSVLLIVDVLLTLSNAETKEVSLVPSSFSSSVISVSCRALLKVANIDKESKAFVIAPEVRT